LTIDSEVATPRHHRLRSWLLASAAVVALTAAQLWYQGGAPSYRTVFAEDGVVFFRDAVNDGLGSLTHSYSGYLVTIARLLAIPATWFPLDRLASYFAVAGALAGALIAVSVYVLTDQAIDSRLLRAALAFAVALHPVLAGENLANITNILWVLLFAVFWALVRRPNNGPDVALAALIAFLGATSTSVAVIFLPVAVWAVWARRDRSTLVITGSFAAGLLLQAVAYLSTSDHGPTGQAHGLPTLYVARVLGVVAVGVRGAQDLWNAGGRALLFPFALVLLALVGALVVFTRGTPRTLGLVTAGYSVVLFAAPLAIRGTAAMTLGHVWTDGAQRYAVLPVLFLIASLAITVSHLSFSSRARLVLACLLTAQLVIVTALTIHTRNSSRSNGPEWYPELVAAARSCHDARAGTGNVPITPGGAFDMQLACTQLLDLRH